MPLKSANRKLVALLPSHFEEYLAEKFWGGSSAVLLRILSTGPGVRHVHPVNPPGSLVNGGAVHIHHILSFGAVCLIDLGL